MPKIIIRSNDDSKKILHVFEGESLWGANLSRLDLSRAAMYAVGMDEFKSSGSPLIDLQRGKLDISGANFTKANLSGAVFSDEVIVGANFSNTNLSGAIFVRTNLVRVNLRGANLTDARFMSTCFSDCTTLHFARGLDLAEHAGPSALDARTLRASVANLPDQFMLGVGYSEDEIKALRALYGTERTFSSCFISYARSNAEFANQIRRKLLKSGISCWQDVHDMRGGTAWRGQIYKAIEEHDKLVLICSSESLTRPAVVEEILEAIDRERGSGSQKLFPIRIDDFILSDELQVIARNEVASGRWRENWVTYVRSYHIPDFSQWSNPRKFRHEYSKLLDALTEPPKRKSVRNAVSARPDKSLNPIARKKRALG